MLGRTASSYFCVVTVAMSLLAATPSHGDEWTDFNFYIDPRTPTDQDTFDLRAWRWFPDSGYGFLDQSITVTGTQIDLDVTVLDYHFSPGGVFLTVMTPVGAYFDDFGPLPAGQYQVNAQMWKTYFAGFPGALYDEATFHFTVAATAVTASIEGDFNGNGVVDLSDYTVWRNSVGMRGVGLAADSNLDEVVDDRDYSMWKSHFGNVADGGPASGLSATPEPSTFLLMLVAAVSIGVIRRK